MAAAMRICPDCGTEYKTLVCRDCIDRIARAALLRSQPHYLEKVRAGAFDFILARFRNHKPHIQLFNDPNRAFCGVSLTNTPRRSKCPFASLTPDSACSQCFQVVTDLLMGAAVK
jgi:hypothetical protein